MAKKTKSCYLSDDQLIHLAKKHKTVKNAIIISPAKVETADWVRLKCQFGCSGFNCCLVCPPFTPTPQQMRKVLDGYKRAMLIHFSPEAQVKTIVADLEREIFLKGFWKAFGLGSGPCYFCKSCILKSGHCRHPEKARPSMEACGIDVFSTVKKFGFPIEVVKTYGQCPNYYGLILID